MAATGTPTPNIGLRIPQGTDPASVDDINYNSNLIDSKLGAVGNDSVQDQIDSLSENLAVIGSITSGNTNSTYISVPNMTATEVGKIVLTKGVWVVVACADWIGTASGYLQISFSSATNPGRNIAVSTTPHGTGKDVYQQMTRLISTNGETFTLYALQNSGGAVNCYPYLYAVEINNRT